VVCRDSEHRIIPSLTEPSVAVADYSMMVWRGKPQNDANRQEDGKPKKYFHRANLPVNAAAGITALI
jgi:hypothetical protein